jgi:hypothetical protein
MAPGIRRYRSHRSRRLPRHLPEQKPEDIACSRGCPHSGDIAILGGNASFRHVSIPGAPDISGHGILNGTATGSRGKARNLIPHRIRVHAHGASTRYRDYCQHHGCRCGRLD